MMFHKKAPGHGHQSELPQRHPRNPGGNGNQAAEDREHPPEEDRPPSMAVEPCHGAVHIGCVEQRHTLGNTSEPASPQ